MVLPGMENKTVIATSANGKATNERLKVNATPRFESALINKRKSHENPNASHAPSGRSAFERMNASVTETFTPRVEAMDETFSIVITVKDVGMHNDLRFLFTLPKSVGTM